MRDIGVLILAGVMLGLMGLGLYSKAQVWNECRETHSLLYCHNLVSR